MDNNYFNLSAGESIYHQGGMPAANVLPANRPSATMPIKNEPVKLRKAGRKPLDDKGKAVSDLRAALAQQRKINARELRQAERSAETARKKEIRAAHRKRQAEAAILREQDVARANKASVNTLPSLPAISLSYQVTHTSQNGTRHVKVAANTILEVPAGKSIEDAVSRFNNRKRIIF